MNQWNCHGRCFSRPLGWQWVLPRNQVANFQDKPGSTRTEMSHAGMPGLDMTQNHAGTSSNSMPLAVPLALLHVTHAAACVNQFLDRLRATVPERATLDTDCLGDVLRADELLCLLLFTIPRCQRPDHSTAECCCTMLTHPSMVCILYNCICRLSGCSCANSVSELQLPQYNVCKHMLHSCFCSRLPNSCTVVVPSNKHSARACQGSELSASSCS